MYRFLFALLLLLGASVRLYATPDSAGKVQINASAGKDYKQITHYLCDTIASDRRKAEAVYNWITTNVAYDVYGLQPGAVQSKDPNTILRNGSAVCEGYSILFSAMCREAGIRTINITGYTKDWIFDKGDKLYIPWHMWSALLIDGRWMMVDATWGAGFVRTDTSWWRKMAYNVLNIPVHKTNMKFVWQYDRTWLLQDPLEFRYTHLPSYPPFQFSDTIMPLSVFEQGDSAIRTFNTISHAIGNSDELQALSALDDADIYRQYAASIYQYNNRFAMEAAVDYNMRSIKVIDAARDSGATAIAKAQVIEAYGLMEKSHEMINLQSALIVEKYNTLKAKNRKKYADAMDYFRSLAIAARRRPNEMIRYQKTAQHRLEDLKELQQYYQQMAQTIDTNVRVPRRGIDNTPKREYDSLYAMITDSISERRIRIEYIADSESVLSRLLYNINDGNQQLNYLLRSLEAADTLLVYEAYYRMHLQDNMDEGAGRCYRAMKKVKDIGIDSTQTHYLECFDSVVSLTYINIENQRRQLATYQLILTELQWLSNKCRPDNKLRTTYSLWVKDMGANAQRVAATIDATIKFLDRHNSHVAIINRKYANMGNIAKGMQRLEKTRKELELKTILADQQMDITDITNYRAQIKQTVSMLAAAKR